MSIAFEETKDGIHSPVGPVPLEIRAGLVRSVIDELRTDETSFVFDQDVKNIRFVPNKTGGSGKWSLGNNEALSVVLVGEIGPGSLLGPYGGQQLTEERYFDINKKKATQLKSRFQMLMPPSYDLDLAAGDNYVAALQSIASNLNAMQCEHEESGDVEVPDADNDIIVYSFVNRSDEGNFVEINLATDCMFVVDKTVAGRDLFDNKTMNGGAEETLATWPDPSGRFANIPGKRSLKLNKEIQTFDHNGDWVHPLRWAEVFAPGTAVEAHVIPLLWDMSKKTAKNNDRLTRTYQLKILQIRALHPSHGVEQTKDVASSSKPSLKRSSEDSIELSPPKKRAFSKVKSDFAGHSSFSSDASGSSSSTVADEPLPVATTTPAKKDKGKGRAKPNLRDHDVHMG